MNDVAQIEPVPYYADVSCNASDYGKRGRIGGWLRRLADRIDGRTSLALGILVMPDIDESAVVDAVKAGINLMERGILSAAEAEAGELYMRQMAPGLWEK